MPYYKLNGQPTLDSDIDGGSPTAPFQGGLGNAPFSPSLPAGLGGGPTASDARDFDDFPDFEEIIGHLPSTDASASAADSTATTNTPTSTTTQTLTSPGSGLVFNNTFGSGASQALINDVVAAESYLQSLFGNACTVNCSFDVQSLSRSFSGENSFNPITVTYSQFVTALKSHASTPTAVAAANALSNLSDPTGGRGVEVSVGEALILGLPISSRSNPDDSVVLNSVYWTPSALQNDPGDAEAVIEHELTEGIMGRIGSLGIADVAWAPMDFFRFTASGQRDFTGGRDGQPTYFSADGTNVNTGLQYHNSVSTSGRFDGFDLADWDQVGADANATDPFGPGGPGAGDAGTLSATDIQIMEALGWSPPGPSTMLISADSNSYGSVDLTQVGNNYFLYAHGTTTGPELKYNGSPTVAGASGTWAPIGAALTSSGYEVAWKNSATNQFTVWNADSNGNQTIDNIGTVAGNSTTLEGLEPSFNQDLNGDGIIGFPTPFLISTDSNTYGSVDFSELGNHYFLYTHGTTTGPELQYNGAPTVAGASGPWTPIGAALTSSGYEVAWKNSATNQFTVWNADSSGNQTVDNIGTVAGNSTTLEGLEPSFNQDLNGDGIIGFPTPFLISTDSNTYGSVDFSELGNHYFLYAHGTTTGPELQYNGSPTVAGSTAPWTPFAAALTATGYEVAYAHSATGQFTAWNADSTGNQTVNNIGVVARNSATLEGLEPSFNRDLNGDGIIGVPPPGVISTDTNSFGSVDLKQVGNNYFLYAHGTTTGPELEYNGSPTVVGASGPWTPIGAALTSTGYEVAWEDSATDQFTVWNADTNANQTVDNIGVVAGNSPTLEQLEPSFNQDLNGDGFIGGNASSSANNASAPSQTVADASASDASGSAVATVDPWSQTDASLGWLASLNSSLGQASQGGLGEFHDLTGFDFAGASGSGTNDPSAAPAEPAQAGSGLSSFGSNALPPMPQFGGMVLESTALAGAGAAGMADSGGALEQVASPVIAAGTLHHT